MSEPLLLGTVYGQSKRLATINPQDLLHHTLIVGQSGSGKSFLIARLIEEILLRTRARVVVIDPNGDFRRLSDPALSTAWGSFAGSFAGLADLSKQAGVRVFD